MRRSARSSRSKLLSSPTSHPVVGEEPVRATPPITLADAAVRESVDGLLAFDRGGRITLWNPAMERMWGLPAGLVLGRVAWDVFPFLTETGEDQRFLAALAGQRITSENRPFRVAGSERDGVYEARYTPQLDGAGEVTGVIGVVRDVTARVAADRARERAERAADRSRRLQALTAALSEAATVEQVADVIVFRGMEAIGADAGSLALVHEAGDGGLQFEIVRTSGFPTDVVARYRFFPVTPGRPLSDAVLSGVPVLLDSAAEWAEQYASVAFETTYPQFEAFAGLPIISRGKVLAGISFSFRGAHHFDESVRTFLGTLTEQCAQALERAWLFETERQARESAEAARAEAEAASRAKGEFLAAMSHELRTPLNAIAGYSELLLLDVHGPLTDAQRGDLERLQRSQRHLLSLVEDVLSFATLDAGRARFTPTELSVGALLADLEAEMAPRMASKGLHFAVVPPDPDMRLRADVAKLRQVLHNLLSNAVKFTESGGSVVLAAAGSRDAAVFTVRDTGRGIAATEREAIFAPFVQLDRGYTRTAEGAGLGLAIARELARGMGGELAVESELGVGSLFTVTIPRG